MNQLNKTKAVIFDMDGLLIDSEILWDEAVNELFAKYDVDCEALMKQYNFVCTGVRIDQVIETFCRLSPHKKINQQKMMADVVDLVIEKILQSKPLMPGVFHAFDLCKALDLKVGLASSSPMKVIQSVICGLGISDKFETVVSAEKLAYGKPNPEVYLIAAKEIGENPLNCISMEDSIAGMIAAKAAQMKSIVVPAKADFNWPQWSLADHKLSSLTELTAQHFK